MFRGLIVVCFFYRATVGDKTAAPSCGVENKRIQDLKAKVLSLENELEQMKVEQAGAKARFVEQLAECNEGQRISLTKFGSQCVSLSNDVMRHVLKSTDLDEQILHHISNTAVAAKQGATKLTNNIVNKVSSVNYTEHYQTFQSNVQSSGAFQALMKRTESVQPYVDKAKPILDKAKDVCQPVLQKAEPMLAKAKDLCQPVIEKALETCSTAMAAVEGKVIPALRTGGAEAFGAGSTLDRIVAPLYEKAGSIAPQHQDTLPQHPVDRVLFIVAFVLFAYYTLYLALFSLRVILKFLGKTTLMSFLVFRIVVMFPLRLAKKIISYIFWMATGFYCCGLCSKNKSSKQKKAKGQNGAAASKVTMADLEKVLKTQKGKNEDKAVKLLADHAKSGKPLGKAFKAYEGKSVTKEVLSQTCKKLGIKASI